MTTLYEGMLGNTNLIYPPNALLEATVQLVEPATTVRALLRGFDIGFLHGDRPLTSISVQLETSYGDTPTEVKVIARTRLAGPLGEWPATKMFLWYTLVAESDD